MSDDFMMIAARIRELREISGLSEKQVADELEIDTEVYVGYEQNGVNIPISVLYQLSGKYKVDLTEILTGKAAHMDTFAVVKKGHGASIDRYPGYSFSDLAYKFRNKVMEPLLVIVEPSDHDPALVTHSGQEFNLVLEGTIEVLFEEKRLLLTAGDSIYFDPMHPHGQRAVGAKAIFLTVITH